MIRGDVLDATWEGESGDYWDTAKPTERYAYHPFVAGAATVIAKREFNKAFVGV